MTAMTTELPRPFMSCRPGVTTVSDLLSMTSTLSRNRFLIVIRDAQGQPAGLVQFKGPSVLSVESGALRGIEALRAICAHNWSSMEAYDISGATEALPTPIGSVDSMLLQVAVDRDHQARDQGPDPDLTDTSGLSEELSLSREQVRELEGGGACPFGFDAPKPEMPASPAPAPTQAHGAVIAQDAATPVVDAVVTTPQQPASPAPVTTPAATVTQPASETPRTSEEAENDRIFLITLISGALVIGIVIGLFIGLN